MFSCYKATAPGEKKVQSPLQNGECCKKKKKKRILLSGAEHFLK